MRDDDTPNLSTDEGYECRVCGSDHAGRSGPCWRCRRETHVRTVLNEEALRPEVIKEWGAGR